MLVIFSIVTISVAFLKSSVCSTFYTNVDWASPNVFIFIIGIYIYSHILKHPAFRTCLIPKSDFQSNLSKNLFGLTIKQTTCTFTFGTVTRRIETKKHLQNNQQSINQKSIQEMWVLLIASCKQVLHSIETEIQFFLHPRNYISLHLFDVSPHLQVFELYRSSSFPPRKFNFGRPCIPLKTSD